MPAFSVFVNGKLDIIRNCLDSTIIEEVQAVLLVPEDGFLLIPARGDVVNSTGIFYAKGTDHNVDTYHSIIQLSSYKT